MNAQDREQPNRNGKPRHDVRAGNQAAGLGPGLGSRRRRDAQAVLRHLCAAAEDPERRTKGERSVPKDIVLFPLPLLLLVLTASLALLSCRSSLFVCRISFPQRRRFSPGHSSATHRYMNLVLDPPERARNHQSSTLRDAIRRFIFWGSMR